MVESAVSCQSRALAWFVQWKSLCSEKEESFELCLYRLSKMENKGIYPTNYGKKQKKVIQVVVNGNRAQ